MDLLSLFVGESQWDMSENGNPTMIIGNYRLTLFEADGGFKFCAARADRDDRDLYFSDVYKSEAQAKDSALAHLKGERSRHVSMTEAWRVERTERARQHLAEVLPRLAELTTAATSAPNVTALRKVEAKAISTCKSLNLLIERAFHNGLDHDDIEMAERLELEAQRLLTAVQGRITQIKVP